MQHLATMTDKVEKLVRERFSGGVKKRKQFNTNTALSYTSNKRYYVDANIVGFGTLLV